MKIETSHLESVRSLLVAATEQLAAQSRATKEAEESRLQLDGRVRMFQGAFDICAAGYAQDAELSESQLNSLPKEVQTALNYAPVPEAAPAT